MMAISSPARRCALTLLATLTALFTLASCENPDVARGDDGFGDLKLQFLHEGREVPGNLIVSNGDFRQEWNNQKRISAKIPSTATLTIDLKLPGDQSGQPVTFRDIIPVFETPEGGMRDMIVYVPRAGRINSFEPVVLMEDRGASTTIRTKRENLKRLPPRVRLSSQIETTDGLQAFVDGIYNNGAPQASLAKDFTCGEACPHIYTGVTCDPYCYTCSTTSVLKNGYYQANYNMCDAFTADTPRDSEFDEIPEGMGGIHLAAVTRNDGIVFPERVTRRGLGSEDALKPPFDTPRFPDFVAKTGTHLYTVTLPSYGPWWKPELTLPVPVIDHQITQLNITLPAKTLAPLTPILIGDTRLGVPARTLTSTSKDKTVTFTVRTEGPDPGHAWVLVPLVRGPDAKVFDDAGRELVKGSDYVAIRYGRTPALIIRTSGSEALREVRH